MPTGLVSSNADFVKSEITVEGIFVRIEHLPSSNSSTPIVLIVPGLGGSVDYTATLQEDITRQGYSTVSFTEPKNNNNTQFVINERNHVDMLLNWLIEKTIPLGNTSNILLLGQSAGGGSVLAFSNDTRIIGVLAVVPANFGLAAVVNTKPVGVIVASQDIEYRDDGISYYDNLVSPKWYCEIRNGSHYLGVTNKVEDLLPNRFTPVAEKYIFAWFNYWQKGDQEALQTLILESLYDYNLQNVKSQGLSPLPVASPSVSSTVNPSNNNSNSYLLLIVFTTSLLSFSLLLIVWLRIRQKRVEVNLSG